MLFKKIIYPVIKVLVLFISLLRVITYSLENEIIPTISDDFVQINNNSEINSDIPPEINDNANCNINENLATNYSEQQAEFASNSSNVNLEPQYDMKQALDDVYGGIYENSETEEALVDYLDKLRPDDSGLDIGISNYILNLQTNNIYSRLLNAHNNNTISCEIPDFFSNKNFNNWHMITLGNSNQSSTNKKLAYNTKSKNVVLGLDKDFSGVTFGIAVGFDRSCGNTATMMGNSRDQELLQYSYLASIYADSYCFSNVFWRAIVTRGYSAKSTNRFNHKAEMKSSYKGKQLGVNLSIGYETSVFIFNIEPELIFRFLNVKVDQYHSIPVYQAIPAELGEFRGKINNYHTDLGIGINLIQSWVLSECVISPKIRVALYKNFSSNDGDEIKLSFMQGKYDTAMAYRKSTILDYNLALDFAFKKVNISVYYNFAISKGYKENSFATKVNIAF